MVSREDLESYFIRMGAEYEEIADGMYLVRSGEEALPIVVDHAPPLLVLRLKVMDLPVGGGGGEKLFRTLLELNAGDMVHGAYGIEGSELVLTHALQLDTLDFSQFQNSFESILMAAASHMETIRELAGHAGGGVSG